MWYGPNLQRSYKYMNFASKMPSLRIDQSDLKCKNGCEYYGNPQWQGYCSKCHREQKHRQRRAEKASSTLPKPEQKKPERGLKLTSHSSFSKFEEKRLRQSETLKKANLLKFSVFKKSSTDDHEPSDKKPSEFKVPAIVNDTMKRQFRSKFPGLPYQVGRDARLFVDSFITDVIKYANSLTVDELSERVQRQYQRFIKHMDTSLHFANVDADTKELLIDFVEEHAMTYLHELPSVVFSPSGTDDERLDRAMSERIQQLSWVDERQLECRLRSGSDGRQPLYAAVDELLCMDGAPWPGGKLARVRLCCGHVLALCAQPASADDLLPALIFTVLKANPPRLVSNINFVTRFSHAQRLMTGEGGYYFTNLCCAVQFIENMTAESLNMDQKMFEYYMAMPGSIGGSTWAAALSLCAELREEEEQQTILKQIIADANEVEKQAHLLSENALSFEKEIKKKVEDVLAKAPLEIKPRREPPRLGKLNNIKTAPLIDLGSTEDNTQSIPQTSQLTVQLDEATKIMEPETRENLSNLDFEVLDKQSPPKSPHNLDQAWDLKQTSSLELLTPSPLGFTPFDSRSIDELMTPDEFVSDQLAPGLSNINYDIDLSDFSGENSAADDPLPREPKDPFSPEMKPVNKDPFSPEVLKKEFDPFEPQSCNPMLPVRLFDEFTFVDSKNKGSDPFEIVPRVKDPFSPVVQSDSKRNVQNSDSFTPHVQHIDPFSPITDTFASDFGKNIPCSTEFNNAPNAHQSDSLFTNVCEKETLALKVNPIDGSKASTSNEPFNTTENTSILDGGDSPTTACLLPSPLQPQTNK